MTSTPNHSLTGTPLSTGKRNGNSELPERVARLVDRPRGISGRRPDPSAVAPPFRSG